MLPLYKQIKGEVDSALFREYVTNYIEKLKKSLNKSDFREVYQSILDLSEI